MTRDRWVILALAIAVLLWNIFSGWGEYANVQHAQAVKWPYRHYKAPTKYTPCVTVLWARDEAEASERCGIGSGCYKRNPETDCGVIITPLPKDFNDERALLILGHELLHSLGGEHD